ncbi:MAG: hypothetical protein JWM32_553 [Verrucomicrobia bacterium]|nr:hypothetical protein [Verrucomicrobiota bacterium]
MLATGSAAALISLAQAAPTSKISENIGGTSQSTNPPAGTQDKDKGERVNEDVKVSYYVPPVVDDIVNEKNFSSDSPPPSGDTPPKDDPQQDPPSDKNPPTTFGPGQDERTLSVPEVGSTAVLVVASTTLLGFLARRKRD